MTVYGLDYAWAKPSIATIKAGGYAFVSRYLSWLPNSKVITTAEARALLAAGIDIFLNWEFDARDALRGTVGGRSDATEAVKQAKALGYPAGATIYHSADFDVTDAQKPVVAAYLTGAAAVEGPAGYRTGCYSGYWTLKYLFDHGVIRDGWQTYAWSGGLWDARAALRQIQNGITVDGASCDKDEMVGAAYSWLHPDGGGDMPLTQDDANLIWETNAGSAKTPVRAIDRLNQVYADVEGMKATLAQIQASLASLVAAPTAQQVAHEVLDEEAARLAQ